MSKEEAAISICGGKDSKSSALTCEEVAQFAMAIQDNCVSGDRVGGTNELSASRRIEIIHS